MLIRDVAYEILCGHGMTTIFGNPGSNELPFLASMPQSFGYVLGLHEGAVVAMADGCAQVAGRPVLVNLHSASGSGNARGALTNAVYGRSPLVVMAGQQVRPAIGAEAMLSNVEPTQLAKPLVGWASEPSCAADVPRSLAQAIFEAQLRRKPTYLSVPYDDWEVEAEHGARVVLTRAVEYSAHPGPGQVTRIAEMLRAAALQWFAGLLDASDAPGMTITGLDFTHIAEGYGVSGCHAGDLEQLRALLSGDPRAIG